MNREHRNWLCRLGLHDWRNYGESIVITWKEPTVAKMRAYEIPHTSTHSRKVFTKRECLRCGIGMKRKLVNNPDGTLSSIGWEPLSESEYEKDEEPQPKMTSVRKAFAKYFVHGIAFSFLFLVLAFVLFFLIFFLIAVGSFIGLIIGFGILMLVIGGVNSFLADVIWGVETSTSFWSLLLHGFALFLILLLVNGVLVMVPNVAFPSIATTVITFVIGAFAGGFVGKKVAEWFEEEFPEEISKATEAKWADAKL